MRPAGRRSCAKCSRLAAYGCRRGDRRGRGKVGDSGDGNQEPFAQARRAGKLDDAAYLWAEVRRRTAARCYGDLDQTQRVLATYMLDMATSASEYVAGKAIRLDAFRKAGGTMSDHQVFEDLITGIDKFDRATSGLFRELANGDVQRLQDLIRNSSALSHFTKKGDTKISWAPRPSKPRAKGTPSICHIANSGRGRVAQDIRRKALDSGSTRHIVCDPSLALPGTVKCARATLIKSFSNEAFYSARVASIAVRTQHGVLCLEDVLIVPEAHRNLISEPLLQLQGYTIKRAGTAIVLTDPSGFLLAEAVIKAGEDLMPNIGTIISPKDIAEEYARTATVEPISANEAHRRYGHISEPAFRAAAARSDPQVKITEERMDDCMPCLYKEYKELR